MEIKSHGNTCFSLKGKKIQVIINPDREAGKLKGNMVISSLKEGLEEVEGATKVFDWPGEYEMQDVPITGFRAWTQSKSKEDGEEDQKGNENDTILFYFQIEGIKFCHLGDLGHKLTSETVSKIGDVDVLMINAGKGSNLDIKKAVEVIEDIEPKVIIPMGMESPESILKELGADKIEMMDSFIIKSASDLPVDKRAYIGLNKA